MTTRTTPSVLVLGLACAMALVGCGKRTTTNISIINSSTSELRVNAWLAAEVDPNDSNTEWADSQRAIEPGGDTTFALESSSSDQPVVVRLVAAGADSDEPYWIQLEPPAPFILRVRGSGSNLTMTREDIRFDENATGPGGIPPAPAERRYRGSLPPWVAR